MLESNSKFLQNFWKFLKVKTVKKFTLNKKDSYC